MLDTHQKIKDATGFVIVTAEYNCSLPPALTNLLDHFPLPSYRHKPASIASYSMGSLGGTRAAALARPFLSELGMVTLPSVVLIPTVQNAKIAEDGGGGRQREVGEQQQQDVQGAGLVHGCSTNPG